MSSTSVTFILPDHTLGKLDVIAKRENRTRSDQLRKIIKDFLQVEDAKK